MNPFLIVSIIIFIISDAFMFAALLSNSKMAEMKIRLKDMEHEIELQYRYYENISNQFREIREYRHDIKNLISAAEMVMNDSSFRETGKEMLESMKERAENLAVPLICKNPIVNAVIWQKSKEAEERISSSAVPQLISSACIAIQRFSWVYFPSVAPWSVENTSVGCSIPR